MNRRLIAVAAAICVVITTTPIARATSLQVTPLSYTVELKPGEKKKGFIDFTNPSAEAVTVDFSVQAFKQINNNGDLQFYDDEHVKNGVLLDYTSVQLGPREAIHLAFMADGTKLAAGASFAAIFATTEPAASAPLAATARVGALLFIQNGTTPSGVADITSLQVPFWQTSGNVTGFYSIKNTANSADQTGFFPQVNIALDPLHAQVTSGSSLVFAGVERTNQFSIPANRFGLYKVSVAYGNSRRDAWVFVATPIQLLALGGLVVAAVVVAAVLFRRNKKARP